jgi:hypothetical protein
MIFIFDLNDTLMNIKDLKNMNLIQKNTLIE